MFGGHRKTVSWKGDETDGAGAGGLVDVREYEVEEVNSTRERERVMENQKQLRRSRRLNIKVNVLPEEILLRIFEYMSYKQLMAVVLVCKRWRLIGETPTLWSQFPISVTNWNQAAMPMILKYRRLELLKEISIEAELWDYVNQAIWRHPNIVTLRFAT